MQYKHLSWLSGWLVMASLLSVQVQAKPPASVVVAPVQQRDFADQLEALGTLRANESVTLTSSVTETISALHFQDGDRVSADTLLVEMTRVEEQAHLQEARALAQEAQRQYKRVRSLAAQGSVAESLLDERRREWQTAQARLHSIESQLADRIIKAPFAGLIGLRNISIGALVKPGDPITTLDDDSVMKLDLNIPAVYLASLHPGLRVEARTKVYAQHSFAGKVQSIDSRVDPITRSIIVRVLIPNPEHWLKPGMLMQVTLYKDPRTALIMPEAALRPEGKQQFVLLARPEADGHKVVRQAVQIGGRRPGEVEVLAGLQAGDLVITHGVRVRPGQRVAVRSDDNSPRQQLAEKQP